MDYRFPLADELVDLDNIVVLVYPSVDELILLVMALVLALTLLLMDCFHHYCYLKMMRRQ